MAKISIPPVLRSETNGQRSVGVEGRTAGEALQALIAAYPSLGARLSPESGLPDFLNVFVDGENVRMLAGLETPISDESSILLLPAMAGGSEGNAPDRPRRRPN